MAAGMDIKIVRSKKSEEQHEAVMPFTETKMHVQKTEMHILQEYIQNKDTH